MRHQHACRVVAAALFAALCGAIECQPATLVLLAGPILWDATDAGEVLRFYRDFVRDAPDELGTVVRFGAAPPLPDIPQGSALAPGDPRTTLTTSSITTRTSALG